MKKSKIHKVVKVKKFQEKIKTIQEVIQAVLVKT